MIHLWYDQNGALLGTPWKVEIDGKTPFFAARVDIVGKCRTVYRRDQAPNGVMQVDDSAVVVVDGKEIGVRV